jgi:hypothetical protein
VHFGICGAYILYLGCPKMQKSTVFIKDVILYIVKKYMFVKLLIR